MHFDPDNKIVNLSARFGGLQRGRFACGDAVTLQRPGSRAHFISAGCAEGSDMAPFDGFPPLEGTVAAQIAFGGCAFHERAVARMGGADWPMLWLEGDFSPGTAVSGAQTFVLEGLAVQRIHLGGRVVGSVWSDADADYCLLAGVLPKDLSAGRGEQTTNCFEQIEAALGQAGMTFSNVVRTWLYLDDLLSWYDDFNRARTAFFQSRNVFAGLVPASTGIGAANPAGAALAAGALAVRPRHGGVRIEEVASPLQCAATDYRSSFARAVELAFPDRRLLLISGTASIAPGGESLHEGDVGRQIDLTLDVVEAILRSRRMDWSDVTRAIGYFRDFSDRPVFHHRCQARGIPPLPLTPVHAAVCRDDLLFEIELDALAPQGGCP